MPMKKLLFLLLLPMSCGQFAGVSPVSYTAVTSNNEMGILTGDVDVDESPTTLNFIYTDTAVFFAQGGSIPSAFDEAAMLHTRDVDRTTMGASTVVSVTVDQPMQICVWHDDVEAAKPTWLTTTYQDEGHDIDWSGGVMSAYCDTGQTGTVNFAGNCDSTCVSAPEMYWVTLTPSRRWVPPMGGGGPAPDNGDYRFPTSSSNQDESTAISLFLCERLDGSDGAVSIDITDLGTGTATSGVDYTAITDTTCSWADGETGTKDPLEITVNALTQNDTINLGFTNAVGGISAGSPITHTVTILDSPPPSTADKFVNATAACSNAWDGEAKTDMGGGNGPWCTLGRANAVAGGTIVEVVGPHTFVNDLINPANAGSNGDPTLWRPVDGTITLEGGNGTHGATINVAYFSMTRAVTGDYAFHFSGEGQPNRGNGVPGVDMDKILIANANGDNFDIDISHGGTNQWSRGYSGVEICNATDGRLVLRSLGHGNPMDDGLYPGGHEYGDTIQADDECPTTDKVLIEDSFILHPGHNLYVLQEADQGGFFRNNYLYCWWWDNGAGHATLTQLAADGYGARDGTRCGGVDKNSANFFTEGNVYIGSGSSGADLNEAAVKTGGISPVFRWNLLLDSDGRGITGKGNGVNGDQIEHRIAHNTFSENDGAGVYLRNGDLQGGQFVNNLFVSRRAGRDGNAMISIECGAGDDITDFRISNNHFETANSEIRVVNCGQGNPTDDSWTDWEGRFPGVFFDNQSGDPILVGTEQVDHATSAAAVAEFTPDAGSPVIGAAGYLSQSANSGVSSTTLQMDDSTWWPDGLNGYPAPNSSAANGNLAAEGTAGCYRIRKITPPTWTSCITSNNYGTDTIVLATIQDWDVDDEFAYPSEDIGAVEAP